VRALELALFVGAFLVTGLVALALLWSGDGTYRDLARANGATTIDMLSHLPFGAGDRPIRVTLDDAVQMHRDWSGFVTGTGPGPHRPTLGHLWTDDEYEHMADVRRVFDSAKFAAALGAVVMLVRITRARARGGLEAWRLMRDGTLAAAALVAIVGVAAVVAFQPLFLLFHAIFFPQGNYLFDPATSNIVRLYPDWYWEGITSRVGLSFVALALAIAVAAHLRIRAAK
jgi:hypothetical protein